MYSLNELSWTWLAYVGLLLAISLLLYLPSFSSRIRGSIAALVLIATIAGSVVLFGTDVGQQLPLLRDNGHPGLLQPHTQEGLEVYIKYGCPNCHLLNGWGPINAIGPDLANAFAKHGSAWVGYYLRDPTFRGDVANPVMPHYTFLKETELEKLIVFIESAAQPLLQNNEAEGETHEFHQGTGSR